MRKYIKNTILFTSLILLVCACEKSWLDLYPTTSIATPVAIKNYSDLETAKIGLYDALQESETYYGARQIYRGDVAGDDMQAEKTGNRTSGCYEMRYTKDDCPNMWTIPYRVVRHANNILEALDAGKVTDGKEADINDIKGQTLAIRALVHFDLARNYGKPYTADQGASFAAPLITSAVTADYKPARNTVAELYTQSITDLTAAIGLLKDAKNTGYINKWAAKALLARIYLYKGDNDNAYSLAVDVVENSPYTLFSNANYASEWKKAGHSESIFEIANISNEDWVDREAIGYLCAENGYADMIVTKSFLDLINLDPDDVRLKVLKASSTTPFITKYGTQKVWILKYPGTTAAADVRIQNVCILRLSETVLIAAEAAAKKGDGENAAKYLNLIVSRANPDKSVTAAEATVDRVLLERRLELVGEGHRFYDALRNNQTIVRYTESAPTGFHYVLVPESKSFDRDYFRTILAIPVAEENANENIKPNNPNY